MRVVLDLQPLSAPATSHRGIGYYAREMALAMCREPRDHEVHLLLSLAAGPEPVVAARELFRHVVEHERVHALHVVPTGDLPFHDRSAAGAGNEALREALLASLQPDVAVVTSLFEMGPDFPTSIGRWSSPMPTAVVVHDLLPFEHPEQYLKDPVARQRYGHGMQDLQRAAALLTNSHYSRERAVALLDPCPPATAILGAAVPLSNDRSGQPPARVNDRSVVLCVGGDAPRKNLHGVVQAWGQTSETVRRGRVLVVACELSSRTGAELLSTARASGLAPGEVVLTGFIPPEDLEWLYDNAELFVLPSFAEGLGLPVLEAMSHGCPTIVANTTSLRELVTLDAARFDPSDPASIANCITRALADPALRADLRRHAAEQSGHYTWQQTAARAWDALEQMPTRCSQARERRPSVAVVAPWPPTRSGVADYALGTTAQLARICEVTMVGDAPPLAGAHRLPREEFLQRWHEYDHVLYHFGNSPHHTDDMAALPSAPGVVVLHDSTVTGTLRFADEALGHPGGVEALLLESSSRTHQGPVTDQRGVRPVLAGAVGVHVHSLHAASEVARAGFSQAPVRVVPLPALKTPTRRSVATSRDTTLRVGHFGFVHAFKLPDLLVEAVALASTRLGRDVELLFVGSAESVEVARLQRLAKAHRVRTHFLGFVGPEDLDRWTSEVDCAVQLRSVSHGESSGSVVRLLAAGTPTIVSDIGSFADLPRDVVRHHRAGGDAQELAALLEECLTPETSQSLGSRARAFAQQDLSLENWSARTLEGLRAAYDSHPAAIGAHALRRALAGADPHLRAAVVQAAVGSAGRRGSASSVLASDISVLAVTPFLTGIQRVTLSLHRELVAALDRRGAALVSCELVPAAVLVHPHPAIGRDAVVNGVQVRPAECDWLLCLDLNFDLVQAEPELQAARARGTRVLVNVYDLLVITNPEWFVPRAAETVFLPWLLAAVRVADVITVNSRATAQVLRQWILENAPDRLRRLALHVLPLGVEAPPPTPRGPRPERPAHVAVVGTLEPRKGHADVLDAFELLWAAGNDVRLTFIGRQGWLVEPLVDRLRSHPELGTRLSWLSSADDEELEGVLQATDAVVVASLGEGYGLPVVEAAVRGLRLFVRDIPVLREVAGDGVDYFTGGGPELAAVVESWLKELADSGGTVEAARAPVQVHAWSEVAGRLLDVLDGA